MIFCSMAMSLSVMIILPYRTIIILLMLVIILHRIIILPHRKYCLENNLKSIIFGLVKISFVMLRLYSPKRNYLDEKLRLLSLLSIKFRLWNINQAMKLKIY